MKVHNIRYGFATNSSSSHSIVLMGQGASPYGSSNDVGSFGWDKFVLTDRADKMRYLSATVRQNLHDRTDDERDAIVRGWFGDDAGTPDDYVDHQSVITLPVDWTERGLDKAFVDDVRDFFVRDDVVIVGGNDNEESDAGGVTGPQKTSGLQVLQERGQRAVARRDSSGYWTLFDRHTGDKIRLTVDPTRPAPTTADVPELLDVKITDYCAMGCAFCYQGSTPDGKHADTRYVQDLAFRLGDLHVFEVALGGGEPTRHPDFDSILRAFRHHHVVPNFTTRATDWLVTDVADTVVEAGGAVAFSIDTLRQAQSYVASLERSGMDKKMKGRICLQHILGVADEYEFENILELAARHDFPVTLLGWKQTGRGSLVKPRPTDKWFQIVKKMKPAPAIGIDTCIVETHGDLLRAHVHPALFTSREGVFSAYVDAVARTLHTSSFTGKPGVPIPDLQKFQQAWLTIRGREP